MQEDAVPSVALVWLGVALREGTHGSLEQPLNVNPSIVPTKAQLGLLTLGVRA